MNIYPYKPTTLYIKRHSVTGKLYFGKTTKDVLNYLGSGKHWMSHIKKHGKEHVETVWYETFTNQDDLVAYALNFSRDNNIVESVDWLNLIEENGLDGWPPGVKHSKDSKTRRSKGGELNPMFGKTHSNEVKQASAERWRKTNKERNWFNNGFESKLCKEQPDGWVPGRLLNLSTKGFKWYNNTKVNKSSKTHPGEGWVLGMLPKNGAGNGIPTHDLNFGKVPL